MEEGLREQIISAFPAPSVDIRTYSPMALAFLGDGVYSMIVRTLVVSKGSRQAEKLHNETSLLVRASAQAAIVRALQEDLTEEEMTMVRRGRNSNPVHHTRHASLEDYLAATGLECLIGWLYLQDRTDRILELLAAGMEKAGLYRDGKIQRPAGGRNGKGHDKRRN